mmetsp:Transcript_1900/g.4854  ORF Transcript_1900/g.4854 Transcript_1900/m.4854 type:complete len:137 (+) Transcript_1900:150-560(+)
MGGVVVRCLDPCCNEHSQHDPELVESLSAYHSDPHITDDKGHRQVLVQKAMGDEQTTAENATLGVQDAKRVTASKELEDFLFAPEQWAVNELDTGDVAKVPTLAPTSLIEAAQAAHDNDKPIWVEVSSLPHGPIGL